MKKILAFLLILTLILPGFALAETKEERNEETGFRAVIDDDAARFLAELSGGDARRALNAVELGVMTTERAQDGRIHLTMDVVRECIQKKTARYDKKGDTCACHQPSVYHGRRDHI